MHSKEFSYYSSDQRDNGGNVRQLYPKYNWDCLKMSLVSGNSVLDYSFGLWRRSLDFCIHFELVRASYRVNISLLSTFCIFV